MYRLNKFERPVLIVSEEVIFHAATMHTLDQRMVDQAIIIAEERLIRPALGNDFYYALLDEKNLLITSGNIVAQQALIDASWEAKDKKPAALREGDIVNASEYMSEDSLALWKQILWKLAAEAVMLVAVSDSFVQFTSDGTIHKLPQSGPLTGAGSVTPDLRSIKWTMDKKMGDRIDPLMEAMHQWICRQQDTDDTKYPDYTKTCDCNSKGVAYKRKTDIILGIYPVNNPLSYLDRRDPNVHPDCQDCDDTWW